MSEAAAERPTVVPDRTAGGTAGGNFFTRKTGPLPNWAWLGIIGVGGAAVWYFYKSRQASAADTSQTATTITGNCTDTAGNSVPCDQADYGGQVATLQTEIQDLQQGETGEGGTPPPAPGPAPKPAAGSTILTGGHLVSYRNGRAVIGWRIQNPGAATKLRVVLNGPGVRNQVRIIPATATTATFLALHPGHTYVAEVTPIGANGQAVGGPNHVTFVTR
jgi:hypothetical protein